MATMPTLSEIGDAGGSDDGDPTRDSPLGVAGGLVMVLWAFPFFLGFESAFDGLRLGFANLVVQATMSKSLCTCAIASVSSV